LDPATLYILEISLAVAALGIIVGYAVIYFRKPKHFLMIHQGRFKYSVRIKKAVSKMPWKDPTDGKTINFPIDASFAYSTKNGAQHYYGDPKTGLLMRFPEGEIPFEYMDPKYVPAALEDGRVLQIARAKMGDPPWVQYIPLGFIFLGVLLLGIGFMVYKMYSAAHAGA
jgi:hypothetical protein